VGVLLLLLGVVVLVVTTRASSRLIARLRRLREETLSLSRERLPGVVARLRQGEQVDVSAEVVPLDLGQDEIGQVADAFNQAQETAIAAAVGEAAARSGLRTVFINIAHRSQGIVHRQLSLLDKAERAQEDPDQLALLFELDHLTTRARRNAENLIVLGGGQAGRQWRNPVPLVQVVRGAISEAHEYVRVSVGPLPQTDIVGGAVADLSHVIAELVDNATTFSPPTSRVEVRGNVVGRGIVLEIEDQGLGLEPAQLEQLNQMLHEPPDFQAMALSIEPRLGIFVVAQLAARQGIRVTLSPSPAYGGTKAVLLVPADLTREVSQHTLAAVQSGPSQPPASLPLPIGLPAPSAPSPSPGIAVGGDIYPPAPPPARRSDLAGQSLPPSIFAQGPRTLTPASRQESVPQRDVADAGRSDLADRGRPALPRRTRQTHVAAQLRTPEAAQTTDRLPIDVDPEVARRRLAAIQSGTRRARDAQHPTAHRPSSDEGPA
jgi:signal transduction histidine kinase